MPTGTEGELFIQNICNESFFSDYVFANPMYYRGKNPKELCDALVLFVDTAIVIQVKTAETMRENSPSAERLEHWVQKKTSQCIRQINGAVGAIQKGLITSVQNERRGVVEINPNHISDYFGIVIVDHPFKGVIGPDLAGDSVYPEIITFRCQFSEFSQLCEDLTTMGDFIDYLKFRRSIFGRVVFEQSGELDLLAAYKTRRDLCDQAAFVETVVVPHGQWSQYALSSWRSERLELERMSYVIDSIAQDLHKSFLVEFGQTVEEAEGIALKYDYTRLLDIIAQLRRFEREEISKKLREKSKLYVETKRPRYFSYWREPLPLIVFMVSDNDREDRRSFLAELVSAAQIKVQTDEAIGIVIQSHIAPTSAVDCVVSTKGWQELVEMDEDKFWQDMADKFFQDAEYATRDEWDATSVGQVRQKRKRT